MADPRSLVASAVKSGRLKKLPCRVCGSYKVQAHHTNYAKPLKVIWLCVTHHKQEHVRLRAMGKTIKRTKVMDEVLHLKIDHDTHNWLRRLAEADRRTMHNLALICLRDGLQLWETTRNEKEITNGRQKADR